MAAPQTPRRFSISPSRSDSETNTNIRLDPDYSGIGSESHPPAIRRWLLPEANPQGTTRLVSFYQVLI